MVTRRRFVGLAGSGVLYGLVRSAVGDDVDVPLQPYFASVRRAVEALENLGAPVDANDKQQLASLAQKNDRAAVDAAEKILDRYTLARIVTDADGYAHTSAGGAKRALIEQGWSVFLVRVSNS